MMQAAFATVAARMQGQGTKARTFPDEAVSCHGGRQPPNSFSHYARRGVRAGNPFFEGWYLRLVLPNSRESFAFIFAIEAPTALGTFQLIDPEDDLHVVRLGSNSRFHASTTDFLLSHWARDMSQRVPMTMGWHASASGSHGSVFLTDGGRLQWSFRYDSTLGWGPRGSLGKHTGTWLAALPMFEPGYQVLMAHGVVSNGYIIHKGKQMDVTGSTTYIEKNWGGAFPTKWFWMQANAFEEVRDLSVVTVGADREVLGVIEETVGLVCVHLNGRMYEFANWSCRRLDWEVCWGSWKVSAESRNGFSVWVSGATEEEGIGVLGPTRKQGMQITMRDTMRGWLSVRLVDPNGDVLVDTTCRNAQLEVGGEPWQPKQWSASVAPLRQPLRGLVNLFNTPRAST